MSDYHINIFASAEDGGSFAGVPDLQCCSAFGITPQEALSEVLTAKSLWFQIAAAEGKPIPNKTYRPAIYQVA